MPKSKAYSSIVRIRLLDGVLPKQLRFLRHRKQRTIGQGVSVFDIWIRLPSKNQLTFSAEREDRHARSFGEVMNRIGMKTHRRSSRFVIIGQAIRGAKTQRFGNCVTNWDKQRMHWDNDVFNTRIIIRLSKTSGFASLDAFVPNHFTLQNVEQRRSSVGRQKPRNESCFGSFFDGRHCVSHHPNTS